MSEDSLELVFGLIDDYYVPRSRKKKSSHHQEAAAPTGMAAQDLLGNCGPSADVLGNLGPPARQPATTASTSAASASTSAVGASGNDVVARALVAAREDGKHLEDLLAVLSRAPAHAASTGRSTTEQLQRLQAEVRETELQLQQMLDELRVLQAELQVEGMGYGALAPKLASLAHWQERVLTNPLVGRARMHTSAGAAPSTILPTAHSFLQQQQRRPVKELDKGAALAPPAQSSSRGGVVVLGRPLFARRVS